METGKQTISSKPLALVEAFADLTDPRIAGRSKHDLVEMLVVSVCALMCGVCARRRGIRNNLAV
jgi:hypothetical protein